MKSFQSKGSKQGSLKRQQGQWLVHSRCGTTFIELMVVMAISAVVAGMFSRMVLTTSGVRKVGRENGVAADAARSMVEQIRNVPFVEIFARFNQDPNDDPNGVGSAEGNRFAVEGLKLADGVTDGCHIEIILPELAPGTATLLGGTIWEYDDTSADEPELNWELREDYEGEELGFPRDLNGDSLIDSENHTNDYIILPILVRVEWQGTHGLRRYQLYTMLTDFIKP